MPDNVSTYLSNLHDYIDGARTALSMPLGDPRRPLAISVMVTYVDNLAMCISPTIASALPNNDPGYIPSLFVARDLLLACEQIGERNNLQLPGLPELKAHILRLVEAAAGINQPQVTVGADGRRTVADLVEDGVVATSSAGGNNVH